MPSSSQNPEPNPQSTFVVLLGSIPMAASSSLEAAKADAYARETKYAQADEYHWTEYRPGDWRLMSRYEGAKRFSWTQCWISTVPTVPAAARAAQTGGE